MFGFDFRQAQRLSLGMYLIRVAPGGRFGHKLEYAFSQRPIVQQISARMLRAGVTLALIEGHFLSVADALKST